MTNLESILKSRDITLLTKVCIVKAMVSPAIMYRYESWIMKAECWRTDTFKLWLEKTLESPPDFKETKPVNPKGNKSWILIGKTTAEAPIIWPHDVKRRSLEKILMLGKTEDKRRRRQQRMRWLNSIRLNRHKSEQTPADSGEQRSLASYSPWGVKELDVTLQLYKNKVGKLWEIKWGERGKKEKNVRFPQETVWMALLRITISSRMVQNLRQEALQKK